VLSLLVGGVAWFFGQRAVGERLQIHERPGAGAGVAIALCLALTGVAVWLLNPFAGLVLVPALHLWTLTALTRIGRRGALGLVAAGLLPFALLALFYALRFDLGPLDGLWYAYLLVTGHQIEIVATLIGCVLAGILVALTTLALARPVHPPQPASPRKSSRPNQPVFGPGGHAGPGALGGTRSSGSRR
jgi:hypothetical protein